MNKSTHEKVRRKHDSLCDRVARIARQNGYKAEVSVDYYKGQRKIGEIDVLVDNHIYVECKCTYSEKSLEKGKNQVNRAYEYGRIDEGYVVLGQYVERVI